MWSSPLGCSAGLLMLDQPSGLIHILSIPMSLRDIWIPIPPMLVPRRFSFASCVNFVTSLLYGQHFHPSRHRLRAGIFGI